MASSGALSPTDTAHSVLQTGEHHLYESLQLTFLKNVYGGMLLSSAGLLSLILTTGSPSLTSSNPGIARLLQGFTFPFGLLLVYFIGAELFTGYPMWYTMTALERKGRPTQYVKGAVASWIGNLVGTVAFAGLFTVATEVVGEEPFVSGIREMIVDDVVEMKWHVIFLRGILCGFLVS